MKVLRNQGEADPPVIYTRRIPCPTCGRFGRDVEKTRENRHGERLAAVLLLPQRLRLKKLSPKKLRLSKKLPRQMKLRSLKKRLQQKKRLLLTKPAKKRLRDNPCQKTKWSKPSRLRPLPARMA